MMGTVDGRIQTERWSLSPAGEAQYEAVHALFKADAWMCGRATFQKDFLEQTRDSVFSRKVKVPKGDFIAVTEQAPKATYAIAVDASGRLRWPSNDMRGDRLIVLVSEKAPAAYLADLRAKSISYLVSGKSEVSFGPALSRLRRSFGIRKIMLEGGGGLNGGLLAAGLIDEISVLVCPYADGSRGLPTVFDLPKEAVTRKATKLSLISAKPRPGGIVWLRYRVA